jgi:hypothetical protein
MLKNRSYVAILLDALSSRLTGELYIFRAIAHLLSES